MILNVCHRGDKVLDKVGGYTDCKSQPMSEAQRVIHPTGWCCCVKTAPGTSSTLTWALRPDQGSSTTHKEEHHSKIRNRYNKM